MKKYKVLVLNFILIIVITFAQNTSAKAPNEPLHVDLGKAMGFIMGQRFMLNRIKAEYPALSAQVEQAKLEFNHAFGVSEKNIEKELKDFLKKEYPEHIAAWKKHFAATLNTQLITQSIAIEFLEEVKLRATGEIPSPIIETLLSYQFKEWPSSEFSRGFKIIYRTKEHPKAKGLDLQIEYAKSWSKREGHRPNIIQFFSSNNGRGPAYASIVTRDILQEVQGEITREEINTLHTREGSNELALEIFSDNSLIEMANEMGMRNVKSINTKRLVIDGWPGAALEFIGDQERLDLTMTSYNRLYMALYKNYIIHLHFQVMQLQSGTEDELKTKISQFDPLFRLMANSLVIQSQYAGTAWNGDFEDGRAAYSKNDYSVAIAKFKLAAAQGHAKALFNIGAMYYIGQGVVQDYAEALKWYRLAAAQGHAKAQHIIGMMYFIGQGVVQDNLHSYMWFNLAVVSGDASAVKNRDLVAEMMTAQQISEAQKLARECQASHFKHCD